MQTGQNRPGIAASWLLARRSGLTTGFQKTSAFCLPSFTSHQSAAKLDLYSRSGLAFTALIHASCHAMSASPSMETL